ncbi:galectin-7-like [Contarinia nasturtii]|uniref:galectin-7-like n=1 Tax=Contarinia nasturtii TaxID=265458 RepID=UPI0012D3921E|nr:galectin-7-like [Contarinia nasturtii]
MMKSTSVKSPKVPLMHRLPESLRHKSVIEISGQMLQSDRFCVDFRDDSFVNFHLSVRPCDNEIVRNHKIDGKWQDEERDGGCPIKYGVPFRMVIVVEEEKFKVAINNVPFCKFKHRLPLPFAKFLYISGEVKIHYIQIDNDRHFK